MDVVGGTSVESTRVERTTLGDVWTTVSVPIPTTAVAFAIRAAVEATCEAYPTPTALTLWLDAIHLRRPAEHRPEDEVLWDWFGTLERPWRALGRKGTL